MLPNSTPPRKLAESARAALRGALEAASPGAIIDAKGYVTRIEDNLVSGVDFSAIEADFRQGDGGELEGKFRAAHSSSALAANTFAPFRRSPKELRLAGASDFNTLQFERKCPHGIAGRRSPNLDLVAEGARAVVGVESKCLEYLSPHVAKFADAYETEIRDSRSKGPWFATMQALRLEPRLYRWLDAAQLVKHAFGLAYSYPTKQTLLLYLFWEPRNASAFAHFRDHREEAERFANAVKGGTPGFAFMSYGELWRAWEGEPSGERLRVHVGRLRARYDLEI